jgi:hypothetical protein
MNRLRTAQIPVGDIGRFIKTICSLRVNINRDLEFNNEIITEKDKAWIHSMVSAKYGNVSRTIMERIFDNAKAAEHLEMDLFPLKAYCKGVHYDLLYNHRTIGLHKCNDNKFRIRTVLNNSVGTTEVSGDIYDGIEAFNRVSKIFGYNFQLTINDL